MTDHQRLGFTRSATDPAVCDCGRGALCDHPAHLAEVLARAGLLAAGTPPETPTTRVLAERADRRDDMSAEDEKPKWLVASIGQESDLSGRRVTITLVEGRWGPPADSEDRLTIRSVPDGAWDELARLADKRPEDVG